MSLSLLQNYRVNFYKIHYRGFTLEVTGQRVRRITPTVCEVEKYTNFSKQKQISQLTKKKQYKLFHKLQMNKPRFVSKIYHNAY